MWTFKIYSLSNFQIHKVVLFTIVTVLYIRSPGLFYLITGCLYIWPLSPFSPTPYSWVTTSLFSVSEFGFLLDSTRKWYDTVFVFPWLVSFSVMPSRPILIFTNGRISFFMSEWFSCVCVCIYVCTYTYVYATFFLSFHLSKTLKLFPFLGYAAMNMGLQILFWNSDFVSFI